MNRFANLFFLLCSSALSQVAHPDGTSRIWNFDLRNGEASIGVEHGPNNSLVLTFLGPVCVPCVSIAETSKNLAFVLKEMPAAGFDPRAISLIATQINEPEVRDQIAVAALDSRDWLRCMRLSSCPGNERLVDLLNQTHAYARLDQVFAQYGLSTHVVSAEKITVRKADEIKGFAIPASSRGAMKVPVNGHLLISVIKHT